MSPVSLALDGLLIGLLIAALIYGIRLERKLKILREGQEKFAQTVRELNLAAGRAEAGLGALKSTAEEVGDTLHGRTTWKVLSKHIDGESTILKSRFCLCPLTNLRLKN